MKKKFQPCGCVTNLKIDFNKEMSKHVRLEKKGSEKKISKNSLGPALSASGFKKIA